MSFSLNTDSHSWQSITSVPVYHVRNLGMADRKAVTINVGGEQIIQVRPELFNVVGDNHFASMFSERWQNQLDAEGHLFVDYSPRVFLPLIEFLRLVRDSEPDMPAPVVVEPEYRRVAGHGYAWSLPCPSSKGPQEGWCEGGRAS